MDEKFPILPPLSPRRRFSVLFSVLIFLAPAILLFFARPDEATQNYHNADTPYHVLLTLNSWKNQPVSAHMFVPSVTLHPEDAKDFTWSVTLPHREGNGNFFYTSFPPLSFVLPYIWFSSTGLPVSAGNLQIFSILLSLASCAVLALLLKKIFPKIPGWFCSLVAIVFGVFTPETLHVSTAIYWAHLPYQLTFLLQLYFFAKFREKPNTPNIAAFIFLSFLSCLVELTAYVGNFGFLILFLFYSWKETTKRYFPIAALLSFFTLAALGLILWHFSLVLDFDAIVGTAATRYEMRSHGDVSPWLSLLMIGNLFIHGYTYSFYSLFVPFLAAALFLVPLGASIWRRTRERGAFPSIGEAAPFLFLSAFLLVENALLPLHALAYSFDRIKAVILFAILFCFFVSFLIKRIRHGTLFKVLSFSLFISAMTPCWQLLTRESSYRWKYPPESQVVKKWICERFNRENSLLVSYPYVPTYVPDAFMRDIYRYVPASTEAAIFHDTHPVANPKFPRQEPVDFKKKARDTGKRWLVCLKLAYFRTAKPIFIGVSVIDVESGEQKSYTADELAAGAGGTMPPTSSLLPLSPVAQMPFFRKAGRLPAGSDVLDD